jgi:tight adherence protein C
MLAGCMPMSALARSEISDELVSAGDYRAHALDYFNARRTLFVLAPLVLMAVAVFAVPENYIVPVVIIGVVLSAMGYSLPRAFIVLAGKGRMESIERGLPYAVDMLTMTIGAGKNVLGAIDRVAYDLKPSYPALANEMRLASKQAQLRSLPFAMQKWADRVKAPSVRNLALILLHSEQLGSGVAQSLEEYSSSLRETRKYHAEARGNRLSFWMLIPTIFCLWTSVALVLMGPAFAIMGGNTVREALKDNPSSVVAEANNSQNP